MKYELTIQPIFLNERFVHKVIVDDHVKKHKDITDDIIIELVKMLHGSVQLPDDVKGSFEYYTNLLVLNGKQYRIVWCLEEDEVYIGVITVYRDRREK